MTAAARRDAFMVSFHSPEALLISESNPRASLVISLFETFQFSTAEA